MSNRLTSPTVIKEICEKYGFAFKKGLGQNFLIDHNVVEDIIAYSKIDKSTSVLEIGPGFGSLTEELLNHAHDVTSIEIDSKLVPVLNDIFKDRGNFTLINKDILKLDLNDIIKNENTVIVANLPYYITSPILVYLLEKRFKVKSVTVMVQKEVALRMTASPGTDDYGALTCLINYYSNPKLLRIVKNTCFIPKPKVDSALVYLEILKTPRFKPKNEDLYFKTVKAVFAQRRKTLLNVLNNSGLYNLTKQEIEQKLSDIDIMPQVRGETLSIYDYLKISDALGGDLS